MPSSSTAASLFLLFTDRLERLGLRYMVTGSVAGILYGEPRLTHDVDLVLEITSDDDASALCAAFPEEEFYCAPEEVVRLEARRAQRGHFNIIHRETGFKADVYLAGSDPLHGWALGRRRAIAIGETRLWAAPPEYVIIRKLEHYREGGSPKHLDDIRAMLRVSGDQIDRELLNGQIASRGLNQPWVAVLTERPTRP